MRKTIIALSLLLTLGACSKPAEPTPVPSPSVTTEAPQPQEPDVEPEPIRTPQKDPTGPSEGGNRDPEPTRKPTSVPPPTDSEPPATQFLKRWGGQYPNVEEATIIRTGTDVCDLIKTAPQNWETSNDFASAIAQQMKPGFGNVSLTQAASFAVDANQNLCPSLS